jgi:hypothetical protein
VSFNEGIGVGQRVAILLDPPALTGFRNNLFKIYAETTRLSDERQIIGILRNHFLGHNNMRLGSQQPVQ